MLRTFDPEQMRKLLHFILVPHDNCFVQITQVFSICRSQVVIQSMVQQHDLSLLILTTPNKHCQKTYYTLLIQLAGTIYERDELPLYTQ